MTRTRLLTVLVAFLGGAVALLWGLYRIAREDAMVYRATMKQQGEQIAGLHSTIHALLDAAEGRNNATQASRDTAPRAGDSVG